MQISKNILVLLKMIWIRLQF